MAAGKSAIVKIAIRISGVVQGVGFRPFVARLARAHGLAGTVRNISGQVCVEAFGPLETLTRFVHEIQTFPPAGSAISGLEQQMGALPAGAVLPQGFAILDSEEDGTGPVMPSPDLAICDDCLCELFATGDPRYRNPFISCTHCGPRFSILRRLPYDRVTTAMADFPMCPLCHGQYADPGDRRYHAQTVCCNTCGPTLRYQNHQGTETGEKAVASAVAALQTGGIVAIKGIGGYHLACSPFDEAAVASLRVLKGRECKPFAVMFGDLETLRVHCEASPEEEKLLTSPARPIVLLRRRVSEITDQVYTTSPDLGAFLPYTPLQHLLLHQTGPLVMTSANVSSLPILYEDMAMLRFWRDHPALAGVLGHDRAILRRLDDSVVAVTAGGSLFLRRARGYVPLAIPLPHKADGPPLLACGGQEKNTFCLCQGGYAYLSAEIGDLDTCQAEAAYRETLDDMQGLLRMKPGLAVCDLHPDYASTRYARTSGLPVLAVQHHHAHIAAVMAEHGLTEKVIGVAFDGTGYGTDGTIWGGEFLLASPAGFVRAGHLKAVPMLGGDESVRHGWKSAACLLHDAGVAFPAGTRQALVQQALRHDVNTYRSSSMGRVFDAASAILDICQKSDYDGQGAIELENAAVQYLQSGGAQDLPPLPCGWQEAQDGFIIDLAPCISTLYEDSHQGGDPGALAWRFHRTICDLVVTACAYLMRRHGIQNVALGGGVFANRLLLQHAIPRLSEAGLKVYRNLQVPPGDGGLALGQAYIGLWTAQEKEEAAPCALPSLEN